MEASFPDSLKIIFLQHMDSQSETTNIISLFKNPSVLNAFLNWSEAHQRAVANNTRLHHALQIAYSEISDNQRIESLINHVGQYILFGYNDPDVNVLLDLHSAGLVSPTQLIAHLLRTYTTIKGTELASLALEILTPHLIKRGNLDLHTYRNPDTTLLLEDVVKTLKEQIKDEAIRGKYEKLYLYTIMPLVTNAQSILKERVKLFSEAAAGKGRAAQALFRLLNNPDYLTLLPSTNTMQRVYLLPDPSVKAVLKESSEQAKEDDFLIGSLADLYSPGAILGVFDIQTPTKKKFGINTPQIILERGYPASMDIWEELSFNNSKLSLDDVYIIKYYRLIDRANEAYVYPSYKFETEKSSYDICNEYQWIDNLTNQSYSFKELMLNLALGRVYSDFIVPNPPPGIAGPSDVIFDEAINVEWKVYTPDVLTVKQSILQPLKQLKSKPFISDMIFFPSLSKPQLEKFLARLTPSAEFNAILTGLLQLMDLHSQNVAIQPKSTKILDFERESDSFLIRNEKISLKELFISYQEGEITNDTKITYKVIDTLGNAKTKQLSPNHQMLYLLDKKLMTTTLKKLSTLNLPSTTEVHYEYSGTLDNLPELKAILESQWNLVLFDTDICLKNDSFSKIPVRSVLLTTEWKNKPISDEAIQMLLNIEQKEPEIIEWIKRLDAPIYKRLSKETIAAIQDTIRPLIDKVTQIYERTDENTAQINSMQHQFKVDLCEGHFAFWRLIENDLSYVSTYPGDTIQKLAGRHNLPEELILKLNPDLNLDMPHGKIKIDYDLTNETEKAKERRSKIAGQFFPRLNPEQQNALLERQRRLVSYLKEFQLLETSNLEGIALASYLKDYLRSNVNPLSDEEKQSFINELDNLDLASHASQLFKIKENISMHSRPTYFNLMKIMYPLLGDVWKLAQLTNLTSNLIWEFDITKFVHLAAQHCETNSEASVIANRLLAALKTNDN